MTIFELKLWFRRVVLRQKPPPFDPIYGEITREALRILERESIALTGAVNGTIKIRKPKRFGE